MTPPKKNLPAQRPKIKYAARANVAKCVTAARHAGISGQDVRKLLAGGRLGRNIPDAEIKEISKGVKVDRWAMIKKAISDCDRMLKKKGLPDDIWVAANKAKTEYLSELSQLTKEFDEIAKAAPSQHNGAMAPHSFGPREQIGNVTAVQVTIGKAQEDAPIHDVKVEKQIEDA